MRWRAICSVVMMFTIASCSAQTTVDDTAFRVQITGNSRYHKPEPVLLDVSFINKTDAPLRLLKWGTPLERIMTRDSFEVIRNGESLPYIGRMVKRGPPQDNDYQLIKPSQAVTGTVDLGKNYALDQTGEYSVRFRPQALQFKDAHDVNIISETFHFTLE